MVGNYHIWLEFLQYTAANIWNDIRDNIKMIDTLAECNGLLWKHMRNASEVNNIILHCKYHL